MPVIFLIIVSIKSCFLRIHVFPETTDLSNLLMDLTSLAIIFCLLGLVKLRTAKLYWLTNFLFSTYFMANLIYHSHFGNLLNLNAFLQAAAIKDLGPSILELFSFTYLLFYLDFFTLFLLFPKKLWQRKQTTRHFTYYNKIPAVIRNKTVLFTFCLVTAFSFTLYNVAGYPAKDNRMAMARDVGILNAQGYEIFESLTIRAQTPLPTTQFNQASINQIKQIQPAKWPRYYGTGSGKNLILVQLESTENFVLGLKVNNQEITPVLNSLASESFYFPNFFSQIGQGNTSDAEFVSNTSLYPREWGTVLTGIRYPSLPRLLKTQGYTSVTFHPNNITYWNRNSLYPSLGFDKYYAKDYYKDEDMLGRWGSSDEVLFKKGLPVLEGFQNNQQKFYASFITMTNHTPFTLPANKIKIKLPAQLQNTYVGKYLISVNYQDYALGQFIKALQANKLWDNSILVVFGDHFGIPQLMESQNQNIFTQLLGRKHDTIDGLNVPLIIRIPGLKPQVIDTPGGQVDLLPTLVNLLDIPIGNQLTFGQDILNTEENLLGFRSRHPDGTFIDNQNFFQAGSREGLDFKSRRSFRNDPYFLEREQRIKKLLQLSDSYVQSLLKQSN